MSGLVALPLVIAGFLLASLGENKLAASLDNSFGFLIDILNSLFKPLDKRPSGMNVLGGLFFFVIILWVRGCDSLLLISSFHFLLVEP